MQVLDLHVSPTPVKQTLGPRPESPDRLVVAGVGWLNRDSAVLLEGNDQQADEFVQIELEEVRL